MTGGGFPFGQTAKCRTLDFTSRRCRVGSRKGPPSRWRIIGMALFLALPWALIGGFVALDAPFPGGLVGGMVTGAAVGAAMVFLNWPIHWFSQAAADRQGHDLVTC